jgi:hypothetical protein
VLVFQRPGSDHQEKVEMTLRMERFPFLFFITFQLLLAHDVR